MSNGILTKMEKTFYEAHVPKMNHSLEEIAHELKNSNRLKEKELDLKEYSNRLKEKELELKERELELKHRELVNKNM